MYHIVHKTADEDQRDQGFLANWSPISANIASAIRAYPFSASQPKTCQISNEGDANTEAAKNETRKM
jgi:hypothetical protein